MTTITPVWEGFITTENAAEIERALKERLEGRKVTIVEQINGRDIDVRTSETIVEVAFRHDDGTPRITLNAATAGLYIYEVSGTVAADPKVEEGCCWICFNFQRVTLKSVGGFGWDITRVFAAQ